ncbi:TIGR02234 family membrane protein [Gordonia sp. (in: high G+C Gram-positive bacteria)]|uniref:TIGR02234 family membrane protein n=1 Tax=Gordonia sp. (in: high G+C Gram-positive bacteria) TaxID=84139 RepID=UPI003527D39F
MSGPSGAEVPATATRDKKAAPPDRRRRAIAAILLIVAALLLWISSRMRWATVASEDLQGAPHFDAVKGSNWSPWLVAVAIVLLAALAVQFVLHGIGLRIVAVVVAIIGVTVSYPAISLLAGGKNSAYAAQAIDLPASRDVIAVTTATFPAVAVLVAVVCTVVAAVFMMRSASGTGGSSSKYTSPAARRDELERRVFAEREKREQVPASEREMWDALDNGMDLTENGDSGDDGDTDRRA